MKRVKRGGRKGQSRVTVTCVRLNRFILDDLEIPLWRWSAGSAVLAGDQLERVLHPTAAICLWLPVLETAVRLFLIHKWVMPLQTVDPIDHRRADSGMAVLLDKISRLGLGLCHHYAYLRGKLPSPAPALTIRSGRANFRNVVGP